MEFISSHSDVDIMRLSVDETSGFDEYDILLLADNHRQTIIKRRKLLNAATDPFAHLEVMYFNNLRAMEDPYIEQVAYYIAQKQRLLKRTRYVVP